MVGTLKRVVTARGWCRKASLGSTFSLLLSSPCLPLWGWQWHPFHTFQDPMFRHLPFCHQMSLFTLLVNPAHSLYGCTTSREHWVYVPHGCHMVILNKTLLFVMGLKKFKAASSIPVSSSWSDRHKCIVQRPSHSHFIVQFNFSFWFLGYWGDQSDSEKDTDSYTIFIYSSSLLGCSLPDSCTVLWLTKQVYASHCY